MTLAEITLLGTCTYTMADLRATVSALHESAQAFADLHKGMAASAKVLLRPAH